MSKVNIINQNSTLLSTWNLLASFFDGKCTKESEKWVNRRAGVVKCLSTWDISMVQEVTPEMAIYLSNSMPGYHCLFMTQTPSEVPIGLWGTKSTAESLSDRFIVGDVETITKKYIGTAMVGLLIKKTFTIEKIGKFWLKKTPNIVPTEKPGNSAFGNTGTHRLVMWARISLNGKPLYCLTTHFPLSGGTECRMECVKVIEQQIKRLVTRKNHCDPYILGGDFNAIFGPKVINELKERVGPSVFSEPVNTWAGFSFDEYKKTTQLDDIYTNCKIINSGVVFPKIYGQLCSDHGLVAAEIAI
jgi:endonuclease/exonuclease/phosphatase family metal-dependent hydrolase